MVILSRLFAALAVLALTGGLTAYSFQATLYAPEQTREAIGVALEDAATRNLVADSLVVAVTKVVPPEILGALPDGALDSAADTAIKDPRLVASAADAVVSAHEVLIGEPGASKPVVDASAAAVAFSDAIRGSSPQVADIVAAQPVVVEIPVREAPMAAFMNGLTAKLAFPLTTFGALAAALAIALAPNKASMMRKIGVVLLTVSVFQVLLFWALPNIVAPRIDSTVAQTVGAVLAALGVKALPYALGAFLSGIALIFAATFVWSKKAAARTTGSTARRPAPVAAPTNAYPKGSMPVPPQSLPEGFYDGDGPNIGPPRRHV